MAMLLRAVIIVLLLLCLDAWGWPAVAAITGAAGLWHIWYRSHYGYWPPPD